jgi:TP901 family phage tail tape measure protein
VGEAIIWELGADPTPTLAAIDDIDAAVATMAEEVTTSVGEMTDQYATLTAAMEELSQMTREQAQAAIEANDEEIASFDAMGQSLSDTAMATDTLSTAQRDNAVATRDTATAAKENATAHEEASGSFMGFVGKLAGALITFQIAKQVIGGVAKATVGVAGDFQSWTETLVTGASEMQSNLDMVRQGILKTADDTGTGIKQLTDAEYMIDSAGQHGKQSLITLTDVAEGAKVGMASLADVANGVTTEMTDYASTHLSAAEATNTLIAAVSLGKTHLADLSTAMATILPTSSAVGVSLRDTSGAMATMTGEGTDAASAATYLRQLLIALEAPAKKGADALKSIGLTTADVAHEMRQSLPDTLQMITDHLKRKFPEGSAAYVEAIKNIAGGSRQMQGILELTGSHLKTFQSNVGDITDAVRRGGQQITGWNNIQQDFNEKIDKAREVVETLGIKIGMQLMPVIGRIVDVLSPVIAGFSDWIDKSKALTSTFDQIGSTFHSVFDPISYPIDKATQSLQNFNDTSDRTHGDLGQKSSKPPVLLDSSDRGKGALHVQSNPQLQDTTDRATNFKAAPMDDSFDRGTAVLQQTQSTTQAVSPLVTILRTVVEASQALYKILSASLGPALAQIGKIVSHDLGPAFQQSWAIIVQNKDTFIFLGQVIGGVLLIALGLLVGLLGGVVKMFAMMLPGITLAISGVLLFVKGIIEIFGSGFMMLKDLFTGNFSGLAKDWDMFKQGIIDTVSGLWNIIAGVTNSMIGAVVGLITGFIDTILAFFNGLSDSLVGHSIIPDMVNKIISWFSKLPGLALQWGKDLINNFIDGIKNVAGNLSSTVSGIASNIKHLLGFSKPSEGPLQDADQYMPDFIELMVRGLEGNTGRLKQALSTVAGSMAANISPNVTLGGSSGTSPLSGGGSTAVFYQILQVLQQIQQQQRGGGSISTTQNNSFNVGGSFNTRDLYNLLNQMAGQQFEAGIRGSF